MHYDDERENDLNKPLLMMGDCLERMKEIESGSVDLILTDLPYGTIKNLWESTSWDNALNPDDIFKVANRILRKNAKMILFSQEPYTHNLIKSATRNVSFNYKAIWEKDSFANALLCNKAMVGYHEDILVFNQREDTTGNGHELREYFESVLKYIGLNIKNINKKLGHRRAEHCFYVKSTQHEICTSNTYNELIDAFNINKMEYFKSFDEVRALDSKLKLCSPSIFNLWQGNKFKSNILKYKKDYDGHHPTQKPVLLLEDLIKTFSNEGDLVVDMTMGSGSTGVACVNTGRSFIGIELDETYFNIAAERINNA